MYTREFWQKARDQAKAMSTKANAPISHVEMRGGPDGDVVVQVRKGMKCVWTRVDGSWMPHLALQ